MQPYQLCQVSGRELNHLHTVCTYSSTNTHWNSPLPVVSTWEQTAAANQEILFNNPHIITQPCHQHSYHDFCIIFTWISSQQVNKTLFLWPLLFLKLLNQIRVPLQRGVKILTPVGKGFILSMVNTYDIDMCFEGNNRQVCWSFVLTDQTISIAVFTFSAEVLIT